MASKSIPHRRYQRSEALRSHARRLKSRAAAESHCVAETVDVILPTHARPHTIRYAIAAVLQQTYPHLVLHVVGDGCDDATAALVEGIRDPRVRFHRFPKAFGYGYAN